MQNNVHKKDYAAVDLFKMACAILVMLIHTKPFVNVFWLDAGVGMLTRFAVPYFFATSGYFYAIKLSRGGAANRWKILGSYLFRLIKFYTIWFILLRVVDVTVGGDSIHSVQYYIRHFFFTADGSALWFIEALMWAAIIVTVLTRWLRTRTAFIVGILFLLIGYCYSTLLGFTSKFEFIKALKPIITYTGVQGPLFFGFPYVALGFLMAEQKLKPQIKKDAAGVGIFFACLGMESLLMVTKFHAPLTFLWISALPMTWFVLRLSLTIPLKNKPIYYIMRKISTLCYVLHIVVVKTLIYIFERNDIQDQENLLLTILTIVITVALSYGVYELSRKKAFSWLDYLM